MRGYLNFFEKECNLITDTAYVVKNGSSVLVCSGEYQGKHAIFHKENGEAYLTIDGHNFFNLQGTMLEVMDSDLRKRYEEDV